jgi:hypothetical protein
MKVLNLYLIVSISIVTGVFTQSSCTRALPIVDEIVKMNVSISTVERVSTPFDEVIFTKPRGVPTVGLWRPDPKYHELSPKPKLELIWQGQPLVHPRGLMLDPDNSVLWISDPGEPEQDPINKPCRIIRVPIENEGLGTPIIFFERPGFLMSAKWAIPVIIQGQKHIIVADQGESTSEYTFTGKGAKVFMLPILINGSAGEPKILWEGSPFACPTGIIAIGSYLYITDPCAGPRVQDPSNIGYSFPTSSVFALQINGNQHPITLLSGPPFTSLIGICPLIPGELIFNDTDSGRPDGQGGRVGFSPPRSADRWIVKILDSVRPALSAPERTVFTEQGDIKLSFNGVPEAINLGLLEPNAMIGVRGIKGTRLVSANGPVDSISIPVNTLSGASNSSIRIANLTVASNVMNDDISVEVRIPKIRCLLPRAFMLDLSKDPNRGNLLADNKHGGAKPTGPQAARTLQTKNDVVFDRFTLDNAPGHGSVWIYPDGGGTPIAIAIGSPLGRPLAGQLSPDQKTLWFTDQQNAALYSIPFPTRETFKKLYGR